MIKMTLAFMRLNAILLMVGLATSCGGPPPGEGLGAGLGETESAISQLKITICHIPPGNPAKKLTLSVGQSAVRAHLAHGDSMGSCGPLSCIGEDTGPCTSTNECCAGLTCVNDLCNP